MAVNWPKSLEDCIFQCECRSQYCAYDYEKKLQAFGLRPSVSGPEDAGANKGYCYNNVSVETFFKSFKAKMIWRQKWQTRRHSATFRF
ncbi:MAG: hypothetical protein ACSLFL_06950 [Alphaproteobacteria bacterium]